MLIGVSLPPPTLSSAQGVASSVLLAPASCPVPWLLAQIPGLQAPGRSVGQISDRSVPDAKFLLRRLGYSPAVIGQDSENHLVPPSQMLLPPLPPYQCFLSHTLKQVSLLHYLKCVHLSRVGSPKQGQVDPGQSMVVWQSATVSTATTRASVLASFRRSPCTTFFFCPHCT